MGYKISTWIVLFLLFFNGGHVLLDASGAYSYIGVQTNPGDSDQLEESTKRLQDVKTGGGGGSTLFGLYNVLADPLEVMFNSIFPGAKMLKNVGVPVYVVNFLFTGLAVVPGIDLIRFLRSG